MAGLTVNSLRWAIDQLNQGATRMADELNALDGAVGDGDLGVTLSRSFQRLAAAAATLPPDLGQALLECAMAFTKVTASTFGTLFATGLMAAGRHCRGKQELDWSELPVLLGAAVEAMLSRGQSALGDKTVVDAVDAVRKACQGMTTPKPILASAQEAIRQTMAEFRDRPFGQGRARIFGEKALGKDDPGMAALLKIVECLAESTARVPTDPS
ncbi:MAG: dihydroxyacetone kinase subunit L [Bryobacteraceae bacterium]